MGYPIYYGRCFIATLVGPQFSPPLKLPQPAKVLLYINIASEVLLMIKDDTGNFPSGEVGFEVFYTNVNKDSNWNRPYTDKKINAKDLWGNEFIYKYPHQCNARLGAFALYSVGENGIDECMSGDDIFVELE